MIDQIEKECHLNEYISAARKMLVYQATKEGISRLTAIELVNALTEIDVSKVDQETFKHDSVENSFHTLLILLRKDNVDHQKVGELVDYIVWKNYLEYEVKVS